MGEPAAIVQPLTAADIDAVQDLRVEPLHLSVKGWPSTVYIKEMACEELDAFSQMSAGAAKGRFTLADMCKLAALVLSDATGNRLYDLETGPAKLARRNVKAIEAIFYKGLEVSGLTKEAVEREKKA